MSDTIVVSTTFEQRKDAIEMAKVLLTKRLVACAQISGPVESIYWWKEKIEQTTEYTLVLKSRAVLWERLEKTIRLNHPYEIPEILAVPTFAANKDYEEWILEELQQ